MLRRELSFFLAILGCSLAHAQILCVNCYEQNEALSSSGPELITNGSFEISDCTPFPLEINDIFCPASANYACDLQDWTCTGGGSSTYTQLMGSSISTVPDGDVAAYFGNGFCHTCDTGSTDTSCVQMDDCIVVGLPSGFPVNAPEYGGELGVSLSQTVTGLLPSTPYVLDFWAGGEDDGNLWTDGLFAVDVGYGDVFLRCKPTHAGDIGRRFQVIFNANTPSHTIKFTNWGHLDFGITELILDDVRLHAAPPVPCTSMAVSPEQGQAQRLHLFDQHVVVDARGFARASVTIADMAGRILLVQAVTGIQRISLAHLPAGIIGYRFSAEGQQPRTGRLVLP